MILGRQSDWDNLTKRVLGLFDQPAYIRRALRVDDAIAALHQKLVKQYEEQLRPVRIALVAWQFLVSQDPRIQGSLDDADRIRLQRLTDQLRGSAESAATLSRWTRPRRVLDRLFAAADDFNRGWNDYLAVVDISLIEKRIEEHNQYYLLEKECAFRSARAAARGYRPMAPFDRRQLLERFPLLPS